MPDWITTKVDRENKTIEVECHLPDRPCDECAAFMKGVMDLTPDEIEPEQRILKAFKPKVRTCTCGHQEDSHYPQIGCAMFDAYLDEQGNQVGGMCDCKLFFPAGE
jgi:hypothetical protein